MSRPTQLKPMIRRQVYAEAEDFQYLRIHGISIAGFFRQAIVAHKKKKWIYDQVG